MSEPTCRKPTTGERILSMIGLGKTVDTLKNRPNRIDAAVDAATGNAPTQPIDPCAVINRIKNSAVQPGHRAEQSDNRESESASQAPR